MSKPNNLESLWMPFTPNKTFKKDPRIIVKAKDMHFTSDDNRQILDGTAGLWCVNAGHGRKKIQEAVTQQIEELDYSPPFQFGHPKQFELANRLAEIGSPVKSISMACLEEALRDKATIGVEQNNPIFTPGVAKTELELA